MSTVSSCEKWDQICCQWECVVRMSFGRGYNSNVISSQMGWAAGAAVKHCHVKRNTLLQWDMWMCVVRASEVHGMYIQITSAPYSRTSSERQSIIKTSTQSVSHLVRIIFDSIKIVRIVAKRIHSADQPRRHSALTHTHTHQHTATIVTVAEIIHTKNRIIKTKTTWRDCETNSLIHYIINFIGSLSRLHIPRFRLAKSFNMSSSLSNTPIGNWKTWATTWEFVY